MNDKMDDAARRVRRANEYRAAQNVDPDWWVKELILREGLTGLAPEPFLLRKDDAELDGRLEAEASEAGVRRILEEFNRRVVNARRQLTGGPPVITQTRDIDVELVRWRAGRARATGSGAPMPADKAAPESLDLPTRRRRWWRRPRR